MTTRCVVDPYASNILLKVAHATLERQTAEHVSCPTLTSTRSIMYSILWTVDLLLYPLLPPLRPFPKSFSCQNWCVRSYFLGNIVPSRDLRSSFPYPLPSIDFLRTLPRSPLYSSSRCESNLTTTASVICVTARSIQRATLFLSQALSFLLLTRTSRHIPCPKAISRPRTSYLRLPYGLAISSSFWSRATAY